MGANRPIDFAYLALKGGGRDGARQLFAKLVAQIVALQRPGASELDGSGGDWGIDVVIGELVVGGEVALWQSKFFPDGIATPQKRQIEPSYESAKKNAADKGYILGAWTLCVPCTLTPTAKTWWDTFRRKRMADDGVTIALWDETELLKHLYRPDAAVLRRAFFDWDEAPEPLAIQVLPDASLYSEALFVTQLRHAGIPETGVAKTEFYNAEVLVREVTDKAVAGEVAELAARNLELLAVWSNRFNRRVVDLDDELRSLHGEVMEAVEQHHRANPPRYLRAGLIHNLGLVHRHAEEGELGWCREWRSLAAGYGH